MPGLKIRRIITVKASTTKDERWQLMAYLLISAAFSVISVNSEKNIKLGQR